jgi:iron(III) transport system ATP-binding protein
MSYVELREITKQFGDMTVVKNLDLVVQKGEFVSLLGPSGCGKTTILRMIAGLEQPTYGSIRIGGKVVNSTKDSIFVQARVRNIGMVFQSYALWPHMTIEKNLAYPLRIRKLNSQEIAQKIKAMLKLIHMEGYEKRYPHQLSGGQQQRISIARALIANPDVLLMDEPLSNLDAKLREDMRLEIKELQKRTQITIIYVTHDHAEAMTISDKVAIILEGKIQQFNTPPIIYQQPINELVANFVGLINLLDAKIVKKQKHTVTLCLSDFTDHPNIECSLPFEPESDHLVIAIRPEQIIFTGTITPFSGTIVKKAYGGERTDYWINIGKKEVRVRLDSSQDEFNVKDSVNIDLKQMWFFKAF